MNLYTTYLVNYFICELINFIFYLFISHLNCSSIVKHLGRYVRAGQVLQDFVMLLQPAFRAVAVAVGTTWAVERDVRTAKKALFVFNVVQVRLTLMMLLVA